MTMLKPEIEITSEMRKAGLIVLCGFDPERRTYEDGVDKIYTVMELVRLGKITPEEIP